MSKETLRISPKQRPKREIYLEFLEEILRDSKSDTARVQAAKLLLDETARVLPEDSEIRVVEFSTSGEKSAEELIA